MAKNIVIIKDTDLHLDTLPKETKDAFDFMLSKEFLINENFDFYLAGGTALALQTGIRKSFDLDFFTQKNYFNNNIIIQYIGEENIEIDINQDRTLYLTLCGAKMSFISYPFFVPDHPFLHIGNIDIMDKRDIAVMKVIAISQRGKKRDFFDLYWCCNNLDFLENIIKKLPKQYPSVAHDFNHILKSLVYFDDAENDVDPEINFETTWQEVKKFFETEVVKIAKNLIL